MSRFKPHIIASTPSNQPARQMSLARGFAPQGGRGRAVYDHRRVSVQPQIQQRDGFMIWWSALLLRRCGSAHEIAMAFDVTEQTGRNWIDAVACPSGWMVFQAQGWWPDDFAAAGQGK